MIKSKWLDFEVFGPKPGQKTKLVIVKSKVHRFTLGLIKWYPQWRGYCFFPSINTIWSSGCLEDIIKIMKELKDAS